MSEPWVVRALRRLAETATCPGCAAPLASPACGQCGIDLTGDRAVELFDASVDAAEALRRREEILTTLRAQAHERSRQAHAGMTTAVAGPTLPASAYRVSPPAPAPMPRPVLTPRPAPTVGLQQVLAAAGAGLVAVAAVVFVFFTLDDSLALRALVTGLVTLCAGVAAPVLRRQRLTATAESVGALAVVLLLVDVELILTALIPGELSGLVRALLYAAICGGLVVVARRTRMVSWAIGGTVLIPAVPVMFGLALTSGLIPEYRTGEQAVTIMACAFLLAALSTLGAVRLGQWATHGAVKLWRIRALLAVARVGTFAFALLMILLESVVDTSLVWWHSTLLLLCAATAAILGHRGTVRGWWFMAGATAVGAGVLPGTVVQGWAMVLSPAGGLLVWLLLCIAVRVLTPARRAAVLSGGATIQFVAVVPALVVSLSTTEVALGIDRFLSGGGFLPAPSTAAAPLGLATTAVLGGVAARLRWTGAVHRTAPALVRTARFATPGLVLLVLATAAGLPFFPPVVALVVPGLLAIAALVVLRWPPRRVVVGSCRRLGCAGMGCRERLGWRRVTTTAVFVFLLMAAVSSWSTRPTVIAGGVLVLGVLLAARRVVLTRVGPWLVALGYGYTLFVLGAGLSWSSLELIAVLCVVSAAAGLVALMCTQISRIGVQTWWAVLATTAVPFLLGVATLLEERSWWSAGAATIMLGLETVLVTSHRAGNTTWLRAASAMIVLPTAAVVVVSVGSMTAGTGSGSPFVLPIIAIATGATLLAAAPVAALVGRRAPGSGRWIRGAVELSVVVTAACSILLAAVRPAAGADVAIAVLAILGSAVSVLAARRDRRRAWWVAGVLWVATLWTALGSAGVTVVEAYTVPPAIVAVVIGILLARRLPQWWPLAIAGVVLGVAPTLFVMASVTSDGDDRRAWVLSGLGVGALAVAEVWRRRGQAWIRGLGGLTGGFAVLAAAAGLVQALRIANEGTSTQSALFWSAFAWSVGAAAMAGAGGRQLAFILGSRPDPWGDAVRRWWAAPALVFVAVGPACGMRVGWGPTLTMLAVEFGLLGLTVYTVRRVLTGRFDLPPTWFVWLAAVTTAIGGWSTREFFRVEVFSVPLGVGLLLAGWWAVRGALGPATALSALFGEPTRHSDVSPAVQPLVSQPVDSPASTRRAWPVGFAGSWQTLAPGLLALVGPSILATFTDPLTWRAVLVVVVALLSVLIGTQKHLAAPFVLGVAVLPIEVAVVFVSQLDTRIDASSWMLTLGAAGGLLLIIATHYERRIAKYAGAAAYVRDLR